MISSKSSTHSGICNSCRIPNYLFIFWPIKVYSNIWRGHPWMITMNFAKSMKLRLKINIGIGCPTIFLLHKDELLHLLMHLYWVVVPQMESKLLPHQLPLLTLPPWIVNEFYLVSTYHIVFQGVMNQLSRSQDRNFNASLMNICLAMIDQHKLKG
jgi:hypothetical protein